MKKRAHAHKIIFSVVIALLVVLTGVFACSFSCGDSSRGDDCLYAASNVYRAGQSSDVTLSQAGKITNVVIFICFSDESPAELLNSQFNDSFEERFNGESESLYDYYRALSYGTFNVTSIFPRYNEFGSAFFVYQTGKARSYYLNNKASSSSSISSVLKKRYDAESLLFNSAINAANKYFSYDGIDLDVNDDGYVDSVSFIISNGYVDSSENWDTLMWPHSWNLQQISKASSYNCDAAKLDGVKVGQYTMTFAKNYSLGLIAHEFAHVLGLPDLYHYSHDTSYLPVGQWDLMHKQSDVPQFINSYSRVKHLGFGGAEQVKEITSSGVYSLAPTGSAGREETLAYRITVSSYESIWIEYRKRSSALYENSLPDDGLIVYRVNSNAFSTGNEKARYKTTNDKISGVISPDEVYVYRPSCAKSGTSVKDREPYELARAALSVNNENFSSLGNATSTAKYDTSAIYLSNGANTGIVITPGTEADGKISFTVSLASYNIEKQFTDAYVKGKNLNGGDVVDAHHAFIGEKITPDSLKLMVKYPDRATYIEIIDYKLDYDPQKVGKQNAKVAFSDENGEHIVKFYLYLYEPTISKCEIITPPKKTVFSVGEALELDGLTIKLTYSDGKKTLTVAYKEAESEKWRVEEGLDMNKVGEYSFVKVNYDNISTFVLPKITVTGAIISLRIDEKNTKHIKAPGLSPSFSVYATYSDGQEKKLNGDEFVSRVSTSANKGILETVVSSVANPEAAVKTYIVSGGDASVKSVSVKTEPSAGLVLDYGKYPILAGGELLVTFSDEETYVLPMDNYFEELTAAFSPSSSGTQTLTGYVGDAEFSLTVKVLPKRDDFLTSVDSHVVVDNSRKIVRLYEDRTLAALVNSLKSSLEPEFFDENLQTVLKPNAYGERKISSTVTLRITSEGKTVASYKLIRIGDGNQDGTVDEKDAPYLEDALLDARNAEEFDLNRDGKYTLTDYVAFYEAIYGGKK